ncbi:MAG: Fpg/Nei family DNA glycosylase [Planctomycetaceae bacterium]|nr:Fpg/Nei family DNA glycosylase [Planctomycetaceae bacterium]
MPEGDTIHQAAVNLRKVLQSQRVTEVQSRAGLMDGDTIAGRIVNEIEARGKHLLMHVDDGRVLHSHMGMTGSWHMYPAPTLTQAKRQWQKSESQAAVTLQTCGWNVVCFSPKVIRLVHEEDLHHDPWLSRLGPDLLKGSVDDFTYLRRIRSQNRVAIGQAMMNQTVISGIGNVYKSEVLFLESIHPLTRVSQLSDAQLLSIKNAATQLLQRNLQNAPRKTRFRSDGVRHWVYGRSGELCLKCGDQIEILRQGDLARSTYFCPGCQPRFK